MLTPSYRKLIPDDVFGAAMKSRDGIQQDQERCFKWHHSPRWIRIITLGSMEEDNLEEYAFLAYHEHFRIKERRTQQRHFHTHKIVRSACFRSSVVFCGVRPSSHNRLPVCSYVSTPRADRLHSCLKCKSAILLPRSPDRNLYVAFMSVILKGIVLQLLKRPLIWRLSCL